MPLPTMAVLTFVRQVIAWNGVPGQARKRMKLLLTAGTWFKRGLLKEVWR